MVPMDKKILEKFPFKRLKPVDGIAVTAQLWDEAHEYHRSQQRYHDLLRHGPGIVSGLEVIASDPPDSMVYVLPGAAVDSNGDLIVIKEPVLYDFGIGQGLLHLLLSYAESRPEQETNGGPLYIRAQFGLEAVTQLPDTPYLELGRVRRTRPGPIGDPAAPESPAENEIDPRFRILTGRPLTVGIQPASIAVCYTGKLAKAVRGHGSGFLTSTLNRAGFHLAVDDGVQIVSNLEPYTLVYLVGQAGAGLNRDQMKSLYTYLHAGGTLFMESCRQDSEADSQTGDAVFTELAASFGILLAGVESGHPLLTEPNLFGETPPGFETNGRLLAGEGMVLSTFDYGCLWQARRRGRPAEREEIRSAQEWGENLITFALLRRQRALST
jgi:hypothetical protein